MTDKERNLEIDTKDIILEFDVKKKEKKEDLTEDIEEYKENEKPEGDEEPQTGGKKLTEDQKKEIYCRIQNTKIFWREKDTCNRR